MQLNFATAERSSVRAPQPLTRAVMYVEYMGRARHHTNGFRCTFHFAVTRSRSNLASTQNQPCHFGPHPELNEGQNARSVASPCSESCLSIIPEQHRQSREKIRAVRGTQAFAAQWHDPRSHRAPRGRARGPSCREDQPRLWHVHVPTDHVERPASRGSIR